MIDSDVDVRRRVSVMQIAPTEKKTITIDDRSKLMKAFKDGIVNRDSGDNLMLSHGGANHMRHTVNINTGIEKQILMSAYENLPELAQNAVRVKTMEDLKSDGTDKNSRNRIHSIRRYLVPAQFGNGADTYILKLTGKEIQGGKVEIENADIHLYDQSIAKKMFGDSSLEGTNPPAGGAEPGTPTLRLPNIYDISIGEMAVNVNDNTGDSASFFAAHHFLLATFRFYFYNT